MNLPYHNIDLCNIVSGLVAFGLTWSVSECGIYSPCTLDDVLNVFFSSQTSFKGFFFLY